MKIVSTLVFVFIFHFIPAAQERDTYTITGKVECDSPRNLLAELSYHVKGVMVADTAHIVNNRYYFKGRIKGPFLQAVLRLINLDDKKADYAGNMDYSTWRFLVFILEPSDITVTHAGTVGQEKNLVEGSRANDEQGILIREIQEKHRPVDEVYIEFIKDHPASWQSVDLLQQLTTQFDISETVMDSLFDGLAAKLKAAPSIALLKKLVARNELLKIGKPAPDFSQQDVNKSPVKLSNLRGKYVLIDFWASWCGPCRAENPNLVKAYQSYHNKGLEILGISLDEESSKAAWLEAIRTDKLTWKQVSDLKGTGNEAAILYNVFTIPSNFLIDPNGIIVGKNLRGEQLEQKLMEVLH